jgi:hypothetical protein
MLRFAIGGVFRKLALCIFALLMARAITQAGPMVMLPPQPLTSRSQQWRNPVVQFLRELGLGCGGNASQYQSHLDCHLPNSGI